MKELLQNYSLTDLFIITIFLALSLKSLISFVDWIEQRLKKFFNKQQTKVSEKQLLERRLQDGSRIMDNLTQHQQKTDEILNNLSKKIDMLIKSDKDDIKSYITKEHHYFCYQKQWIDDFSLDCIEKRYKHYTDEGGNSFIGQFMEQLRALPKQPPQS